MPKKIEFHNLGARGIIRDIPSHLLEPEAWSDGGNVRFVDNKVVKFKGHSALFDPPSIAPYWAIGVPTVEEFAWLYTGLAKAYTFASGVHTDVTRVAGDYTASAEIPWNGGILGGLPIITNGTDDPQVWNPPVPATPLVDLPNWPADTLCRIIRPFKNFLIAMDVTKSGTRFPHMVKWSHSAVPGAVPSSWDETDPTLDAGEDELTDTKSGFIVDGLQLGDSFIIYKEASVHSMRFVGGTFIFAFAGNLDSVGALSTRCIRPVDKGKQHFVGAPDDIYVHDGRSARSLLDKKQKKWFINTIDADNAKKSYAVQNFRDSEMWFCFPESGQTLPSLALVWNWKDDTIGTRALPNAAFIAEGVTNVTTTEDWDSDTGTWDTDITLWGERLFDVLNKRLVICDPTNTKLFKADDTNQFNAVNFTSFVERTGLAIVGQDRFGNPKVDVESMKLVSTIWPKVTGGPINVRVGTQEFLEGAISWSSALSFDPTTQNRLDLLDSFPPGRFIAVRFESAADVEWELHGYDLEIDIVGKY